MKELTIKRLHWECDTVPLFGCFGNLTICLTACFIRPELLGCVYAPLDVCRQGSEHNIGAVNEDGRGPSIWDTCAHTLGKIKGDRKKPFDVSTRNALDGEKHHDEQHATHARSPAARACLRHG